MDTSQQDAFGEYVDPEVIIPPEEEVSQEDGAQAEAKAPESSEAEVYRQARESLRAREEELRAERYARMQMQEAMINNMARATAPQRMPEEVKLEPEVAKALEPYVKAFMGPMAQRLTQAEQAASFAMAKLGATEQWSAIEDSVPDLKDPSFSQAVLDRILQMPPAAQQVYDSNPAALLELAKLMAEGGKAPKDKGSNRAIMQRGTRSDAGSVGNLPSNPDNNQSNKYASMTDEEFDAVMARNRRGGGAYQEPVW